MSNATSEAIQVAARISTSKQFDRVLSPLILEIVNAVMIELGRKTRPVFPPCSMCGRPNDEADVYHACKRCRQELKFPAPAAKSPKVVEDFARLLNSEQLAFHQKRITDLENIIQEAVMTISGETCITIADKPEKVLLHLIDATITNARLDYQRLQARINELEKR
ncbi:hypothetical protein UFOVP141_19 [uncultured Caudovirales phage]|uniref:Uncharacterized protein n=1 Tax=uncultured Caudovirales phage TaxID=2100421 RepID=A0A6J7VNS7_9CAUD|nr:hypothetical protein UFOVP141_19 [uncultured Caudovirales phage]